MILRFAIALFAIAMIVLLVLASRAVKKQRVILADNSIEELEQIFGDVPHVTAQAQYPKPQFPRMREIEPMGM